MNPESSLLWYILYVHKRTHFTMNTMNMNECECTCSMFITLKKRYSNKIGEKKTLCLNHITFSHFLNAGVKKHTVTVYCGICSG